MSRQDADDDSSESAGSTDGERTGGEEQANGSSDDGQPSGQSTPESESGRPDENLEETAGERLEEIAEEPDGDIEAVLSAIIGEKREDTQREVTETAVDERMRKQVERLSVEETARLVTALRSEVEQLEESLAEQRERADDLESRLARKQADFQNYKERQSRERERVREQAKEDVVERFVEVRDNLVRALDQEEGTDIRSGVESTLSLFDDELDRAGVSVIDPAEGESPDPRRHEVLATVPGSQPSGTISETHRPGYETEESVIRPAQVAVSDGSLGDDGDSEDGTNDEEPGNE